MSVGLPVDVAVAVGVPEGGNSLKNIDSSGQILYSPLYNSTCRVYSTYSTYTIVAYRILYSNMLE